jgi:hypothetical protein
MSRDPGEEDLGAAGYIPPRLLSWSCVSDLLYLKARAGYVLQPSMTRKPQLQLFGLQVITTVCSSSDLVGSVWRCGLPLM